MSTKHTSKLLTSLLFLVLLPTAVLAVDASLPSIRNPFDDLEVKIPGMERFSEAQVVDQGGKVTIVNNWIGEYLAGLYSYLIAIIGVFAVVGMAIGGIIWVTSFGNPSLVGMGKEWVTSSLLGLLLALGSYTILNTINPDLVRMRPIIMGQSVATNQDEGDDNASGTGLGGPSGKAIPCPPALSSGSLKQKMDALVKFYLGETTVFYTHSGKNDPLRGQMTNGKYYSDCSSFASIIRNCLGLRSVPGEGTTYGLFISNKPTGELKPGANPDELGLKPGDLVGYNKPSKKGRIGHVLTYIGNWQFVECGGAFDEPTAVYGKNGCVKISHYQERVGSYFNDPDYKKGKFKLYYIKR